MSLACKGGVFIVGAKRTPFCSFGGALRETTAGHAFAAAASDAIRAAQLDPALVDNTVVGNVHYLSQCDGGKTPRYCGIYSGVPIERPALGVNKACGSGLQAIITGALDILTGVAKVSLTGGTEVMSALPYLVKGTRFGANLGKSYHLEDYIPKQFVDGYSGLSLERMAEDLATKHGFNRREADEFALQSHSRWKAAQQSNAFDEELTKMTVTIKKKQVVIDKDDGPQPNLSLKALSALPTTIEDASVVTAGNSSAPSDGAAALLLADEATVAHQQLAPLARVGAWAAVGSDPAEAGLGAVPAVRALLQMVGLTIEQVDLIEINETFASHALVSTKELQLDPNWVNVSGGAIAMGNPVGATGARMAVHLVHQLRRRKLKRGIAASSCGGGQGVALKWKLIEAV